MCTGSFFLLSFFLSEVLLVGDAYLQTFVINNSSTQKLKWLLNSCTHIIFNLNIVIDTQIQALLRQVDSSITDLKNNIVFTDSLSCLQALHHMKLEHPLIGMVI